MFTVQLTNGKKYIVRYVTARALRDIGEAQAIMKKWQETPEKTDMKKDMDVLVNWFCTFCGGQFTADEIYDFYPSDKIITDIGIAILAVNAKIVEVLKKFPSPDDKKKRQRRKIFVTRLTGIFSKKGGFRKK